MKKTLIFVLFTLLLVSVSGCSNQNVSRSKAKTNTSIEEKILLAANTDAENVTTTGSNVIEVTTTSSNNSSINIIAPSQGEDYISTSNWNIIRGTTLANTASVEVNGYKLRKYIAGNTDWNYIASTKMQTLSEGKNTYAIKTFDVNGDLIDKISYVIHFQNGYFLPNVGTRLEILFLISFILSFSIILRRKFFV